MIRLATLFWIALVCASGFGMFMVKYGVQSLEDDLAKVRKQIVAEQQEMRVLNAEWSYLTQPERLADLNHRFLSLGPIATKQYQQGMDEIPLRPHAAEDTMLAAAPAPATAAPPAASQTVTVAAVAAPTRVAAAIIRPAAAEPVRVAAPAAAVNSKPIVTAAAKPATARRPASMVQLINATTGTSKSPRSLNDLISEINGGR